MKRTLLIIGSGTSTDVHKYFPSGIELANLVDVHLITTKKKVFNSECPYLSPMINEAFRIFKPDIDSFDKLIDELKRELWDYVQKYYYYEIGTGNAAPISVDNLISTKFNNNPNITNLAKQCIGYHLKGIENAFIRKTSTSGYTHQNTWVDSLFNRLQSIGWNYNDILENLCVISFNYERLFEYLACKAIKKVYKEDISYLPNVNYIYGRIGTLANVPFEENNDVTRIMKDCYNNIKLIGERANIITKPQLDQYEKVLFLGFGYDKDNLIDTLSIRSVKTATLLGMCFKEKSISHQEIEHDFKISITASTIKDFLNTNL